MHGGGILDPFHTPIHTNIMAPKLGGTGSSITHADETAWSSPTRYKKAPVHSPAQHSRRNSQIATISNWKAKQNRILASTQRKTAIVPYGGPLGGVVGRGPSRRSHRIQNHFGVLGTFLHRYYILLRLVFFMRCKLSQTL